MLILFQVEKKEATGGYGGNSLSNPPSTLPSLSTTQFTHVLSFDQDKMKVVNEVPIEAQRAYVAAREQIQELSKSELKEKEGKEELKESEEEKSELNLYYQ